MQMNTTTTVVNQIAMLDHTLTQLKLRAIIVMQDSIRIKMLSQVANQRAMLGRT